MRDAETDVQKAEGMVKKAFSSNDLPMPDVVHDWKKGIGLAGTNISTAFTLFPECNSKPKPGTLEDLCWDILKDQHASEMREDIQGFINDIIHKYGTISSHEHKSRLHTYFSVNERYISLKVGQAAQAGAFAWDSEKLEGLKELIVEGFEKQ